MKLVEHHVKYKEIHGEDKTVWMPAGEHHKLHRRLRKEGKCNIPVDELVKISQKAQKRTKACRQYLRDVQRKITFYESVGKNVRLQEVTYYNEHTGNIGYHSGFVASNNLKLLILEG